MNSLKVHEVIEEITCGYYVIRRGKRYKIIQIDKYGIIASRKGKNNRIYYTKYKITDNIKIDRK